MERDEESTRSARLLAAVVVQAIQDACIAPLRGGRLQAKPSPMAIDAIRFIYDGYAQKYLEAIGMSYEAYIQRLNREMHQREPTLPKAPISTDQKRCFCWNKRWYDANKDFINLNQPMEIDNDVPDRPSKKAAPQPSQRSKVGDGNPLPSPEKSVGAG